MIKALTVAQPWALKFEIGALVENRDWMPDKSMIGQHIALHGGKSKPFSKIKQDVDFILERAENQNMPGWLLNHIRWHKESKDDAVFARDIQIEGIFAVVKLARIATSLNQLNADQQPWFFGRYGWVFSEYVSLNTPVPCPGQLGLWALSEYLFKQVNDEYNRSKFQSSGLLT